MSDLITKREEGRVGEALRVGLPTEAAVRLTLIHKASDEVTATDVHADFSTATTASINRIVSSKDPPRQQVEALAIRPRNAARAANAVETHNCVLDGNDGIGPAHGLHAPIIPDYRSRD